MYTIIDFEQWDNKQSLHYSCTHLFYIPEWFKTLEDCYNFKVRVLLNEEGQLLIAFVKIEDVKGKRIVNLPFSDYTPSCGLQVDDYNQILDFLQREHPDHCIILKTDLPYGSEVEAKLSRKAVMHIISLGDHETRLRSDSFIRNTKKARKSGLTHRINKDRSALSDFYKLYHQLRFEKFNSIPQPLSFFEAIHTNFIQKGKGVVLEVLSKDKVIASSILLQHHDTLYYKFGCSAEDHLEKRPNNLLFSEMINYARSKQFKKIDLGLSGVSDSYEGLRRWKESMGGVPQPISYWEYKPPSTDLEKEEKVMKNLKKLTDAMIESKLNYKQTSAFSEKIYSLFA